MLLCLASYEQCSTQLLKVIHKCCNTDVLGVLLIYPHSPSGVWHAVSNKNRKREPNVKTFQPYVQTSQPDVKLSRPYVETFNPTLAITSQPDVETF